MKKIVWLTEWLPSSFEPYNGDAIERHAKAASLFNDIYIIYIKKDPQLPFGKIKQEERIYNEHCRAFIYYYPSIGKFSRFLDVWLSNYYFFRLHGKALKRIRGKYGKIDGIQVNITMKNGIIAWYQKWRRNIHYVVLERWGLFLPEAKPQWKNKSWLFRYFTKKVIRNASCVMTVSKHLGEMLSKNVEHTAFEVIPNVVDKQIFYPETVAKVHQPFRFIHISNLDYSKNIEQILRAFKQVLEKGYQAELLIHAPASEALNRLISLWQLEKNIILKGEADQPVLADSIRSSDALVLFSLYETFGNVVIEANACGIPVITSNYPTFTETVEDQFNGIIAKGTDAEALAVAMIECIQKRSMFNGKLIAEMTISRYAFERVGKMFDEIYNRFF
jgi:glycosyltransferase involved in cell wall biosynthesis